jgi:signal transduction histidine kinase
MSSGKGRIRVVGRETAATRTVLDGLAAFETERVRSVAELVQRRDSVVVLVAPALRREPSTAVEAVRRRWGSGPVVVAAEEVPDVSVDAVIPLEAEAVGRRIERLLEETATERAWWRARRLEGLASEASEAGAEADSTTSDDLCQRLVEADLYDSVWTVEIDGSVAAPTAAAGVPTGALQEAELAADTPWTRAIREGTAVIENEDGGASTIAAPFEGGCLVGATAERIDEAEIDPLSRLAVSLEAADGEARPRYAMLGEAVAHEINNHLDLAMVHLDLIDGAAEHVDHVEAALERIGSVTEEIESLVGSDIETDACSLATVSEDVWERTSTGNATLRGNDTTIEADEELLRLVLSNLFRNAVEHGGSDVIVEVGPLEGGGFYVADDGDGFPEGNPERLFEWGWSESDGTGIGLALVGLAADRHGWTVEASDENGARFEFRP